jgi:4-amino-4-deoxy-L-arabinose transferase-like glycosyltransferase
MPGQRMRSYGRESYFLHAPELPNSRHWFLVILVVAVALRIGSALYQGNDVTAAPGTADQISYHGLAKRVVEGHGFSFADDHWPATPAGQPTAHWSYLYTSYLALVYAVFGINPMIARLIQSVTAGVFHTWLTCRIAGRLFGRRTGLVASALSAIYVYFFYYAGALMSETFYFLAILWTFDASFRILDQNGAQSRLEAPSGSRWSLWIELGLAIGAAVLFRQVFLLFVPLLFAALLLNTRLSESGQRRDVRPMGGIILSCLIILMMILPWTIRNQRCFGTFELLNTNAGFALYWGNHPVHGTKFMPILTPDGPSYGDLIPPELRALNEAKLDQALFREALRIIARDPARYIQLSLSRAVEYFKFWPSSDSSRISNISRVASFGLLLPFILYGLYASVLLLHRPEHPDQRVQILLLYCFIVVYTTIHLLSWTLIRYRLPVDIILILFAAKSLSMMTATIGAKIRDLQ